MRIMGYWSVRGNRGTIRARAGFATSLLLAIAALMSASLSAPSAQAQTAGEITQIEVVGAQRIEVETIRSYLELTEGDQADAGAVNAALKRLFATGLFRDVRITPRADGVLVVAVDENPIINQIAFEGNRTIDNEVLSAQISSRPRSSFTRAKAEGDAQVILELYRAAGRFSATVEPKIIEQTSNRVDLVFEITEGEAVGVSAINFVGNTEYSDRRLRGAIETSESAWWKILANTDNYDPDRLEFDKELLRRFYFGRGYADFEVLSASAELNPERTGFFITFQVFEGAVYEVGAVDIASTVPGVDAEAFRDLIVLDAGDTYDADAVEETVQAIQNRAGADGINFINVRPSASRRPPEEEGDAPRIDLAFQIVEAPRIYVERIDIEGNVRTLDRVIRREFEFVEGDAFNAFRLQQSRSNIRALRYFSQVDVSQEPGSAPDRVVIKTRVEEQSTGDLTFGVGFSTADSVGGQVSLTERNFLGRGQFVRASASITTRRQFFEFRFREPYFLDRNVNAGFDLNHIEIDNQDESSFDIRRSGFRPRVGFPLGPDSEVGLNYLIQRDEIRDVPDDASPLVEQDQGARFISSVGADFTLDKRNDRVQPTRGYVLRLEQDVAGLGGDAMYLKSEASATAYRSFFREDVVTSWELAGGALVGFGGADDIRVSDRFTLGGDSFRGFANSGVGPRDTNEIFVESENQLEEVDDALGGKYFLVARADVSFPLGLPEEYGVFGGVFADAGSLWGLEENSYTAAIDGAGNTDSFSVDDAFALRASVGVSVFWTSPFGPLRLNFAAPLLKEDQDETEFFRFSAGTRF